MQTANIMIALGNDRDNTVPRYGVTAAEIAVLMKIHGEGAVFDVEPLGDVAIPNRLELRRIKETYAQNREQPSARIVEALYPGSAARVFETLDELEIPPGLFKAIGRMTAQPGKISTVDSAPEADDSPVPEAHVVEKDDSGIDDMNDGSSSLFR